jgi:hypothetical protein
MNRRSLILLLIGVIASLAGMLGAMRVRSGRCEALGGTWDDAARACRVPAGAAGETAGQVISAYLLGLVLALVVAFMLWRVLLFVTGRGPDRTAG